MAEETDDHVRPLEHLKGEKPPAPDWFLESLAAPSEEGSVDVAGAKIAWSAWGERGKRGLVFIHGGRAHRNWWRPFAPFFSDHYRVVAYSPTGKPDPDEGYTILKKQDAGSPVRPNRVYDTIGEPISRFRFLPNQPSSELYLVDHIARTGVQKAPKPEGGA